ncbi:MAG: hypothetical protein C0512_13560 [Flavobacterium sp.]|nr:hypothetical protein [Flavobacterium sp.]
MKSMNEPLISIIIPVYNRATLIGETLESILSQTYANWECFVVDDGSTDKTELVVQNYCKKETRFHLLKRPENRLKGSAASRNYGYEKCKGDLIYWLDSDDLLLPNAFQSYIENFTSESDFVVARVQQTNLITGEYLEINKPESVNLIEDYFAGKTTFYVCGPMWKRSFLEQQTQLFDESLSILIDWDFNLRMLYKKPTIVFIKDVLVLYRQHEKSLKTNIINLNPEKVEIAFSIRKKHLQFIRENKVGGVKIFRKHLRNLYKQILRFSLVQNNKEMQFIYLQKVLIENAKLLALWDSLVIVFGFFVFKLTGKGYKLLK